MLSVRSRHQSASRSSGEAPDQLGQEVAQGLGHRAVEATVRNRIAAPPNALEPAAGREAQDRCWPCTARPCPRPRRSAGSRARRRNLARSTSRSRIMSPSPDFRRQPGRRRSLRHASRDGSGTRACAGRGPLRRPAAAAPPRSRGRGRRPRPSSRPAREVHLVGDDHHRHALVGERFITPSTSPMVSGSSAEVGSSNSMTSGRIASARAIATRCCWPPESAAGCCAALSASPTLAQQLHARAPRLRRAAAEHGASARS